MAKRIPKKNCENPGCGRLYRPKKAWQKYCDASCKLAVNNGLRADALRQIRAQETGAFLVADGGPSLVKARESVPVTKGGDIPAGRDNVAPSPGARDRSGDLNV